MHDYVPRDRQLPLLQAICVVLPQLPYVADKCVTRHFWSSDKGWTHRHLSTPPRNLLTGFCYAASEAVHHLSEDPTEPWMIRYGPEDWETHWFLKRPGDDEVIDITAAQFSPREFYDLYDFAKRRSFGTKEPSKRAKLILDRVTEFYFPSPSGRDVKSMRLPRMTPHGNRGSDKRLIPVTPIPGLVEKK